MKNILFILILNLVCSESFSQYATEITVDQHGNGDFTSIQEAINATKSFPEKPITIYIKNGVYKEKVNIYSWNNNLTLIGESRDSTIIQWDDYFKKVNLGRNSTFHTYTLKVAANDVTLENLIVENTAGAVGQAVALHLEGDRVEIKNCTINGYQDTVYLAGEGFRQYFENCTISGTTDYIFGAATAVFHSCVIISKSNSYITAASTPKSQAYGLTFINCQLTRSNDDVKNVYLGRPWRSFARTVFINCEMDEHITPDGWNNWGSSDKEQTAFYAEFGSHGPGASQSRVSWSHSLSQEQVGDYEIPKIFDGWSPKRLD